MLDKDKIVVVAIGLVVLVGSIGGGLVWGQQEEASAKFGRVLLAPASALLTFGAMSARKEHRIKIQIFWLLASVVFLATMMNMVGAHWYDTDLIRTVAYTTVLHIGMMLWIYSINFRMTKEHSEDVTSSKPPPYESDGVKEGESPKEAKNLKMVVV